MRKPHKHAELIKAWADGAEIQYRSYETIEWKPIFKGWSWDNNLVAEYRIKPEPTPDVVRFVTYVWNPHNGSTYGGIPDRNRGTSNNLKLTFDGETGKLKSAEVL